MGSSRDELTSYLNDLTAPRPRRAAAPKRDPWAERAAQIEKDFAAQAKPQATPAEAAPVAPKATPARSAAPSAALQGKIQAGLIPQKSTWDNMIESLRESGDNAEASMRNKLLFGVPGKVADAVYGKQETHPIDVGPGKHWEDNLPGTDALTNLPATAADVAVTGGPVSAAAEGINPLIQGARPALQSAARAMTGGALYGGANAALRGGGVGDVAEQAATGAAGNLAFSAAPVLAEKVRSGANSSLVDNAVKPLLAIGQGKAANKAQMALGKGDKALGKEEMRRVIEQQGLEPVIRKNPAQLGNEVRAREDDIWENRLGPVREIALTAEPAAKVPVAKLRERLLATLGDADKGTDLHDDVDRAIALLQSRSEKIGTKGQFPLPNLLKNAREFESDGYGGTEAKFADKRSSRLIGKALRDAFDERVSTIYQRHPELVSQVLGGSPVEGAVGKVSPLARTSPENLEMVGSRYRSALKDFADLKAIEPAAEQLSARSSQERPGLISSMQRIGGRVVGGLIGHSVAGPAGAVVGGGIPEMAHRMASPSLRATRAVAGSLAGPAADPGVAGAASATMTLPALRAYAEKVLHSREEDGE
jgi:hypothetical protein